MGKLSITHPILESPFLARLVRGSRRLRGLERRVPELLTSRAFKEALELEMLRSDRSDGVLTLLLMGTPEVERLDRLARIVVDATRKTDIKGWFCDVGGIRVALLLGQTAPDRTARIVANIRDRLREEDPAMAEIFECEIYTYPPFTADPPAGGGGEDKSRNLDSGEHPDADGPAGNGNGNHGNGNGRGHDRQARPDRAERRQLPPSDLRKALAGYPSILELLMDPLPLWKRTLDLSVSATALALLSPLLLLIALAIKLTSRGPVLFRQPRVGYRGRIFPCWKFRSMRVNADSSTHRQYLRTLITQASGEGDGPPMLKLDARDRRVTAVGRLLRITCLDELPQLFNVLTGEMSLVGPRPCLPYEAENYQRWHYRRLDTVPGITGLWQVRGKNKVSFRKMIRLDILYARQRSLWLDLKILVQTIPAVLNEIRDGMPAKP